MTKKEMATLFELAEKLYEEERRKTGMITIPYAFARDDSMGRLVAVSMFGKHSARIEKLLWAYSDLIEKGE